MKTPANRLLVLLVAAVTSCAPKNTESRHITNPTIPASSLAAPASAREARLPKLLDLGAGKCIACKAMAPVLENLKKEYAGKMTVEFIDVWQHEEAGKKYDLETIPTQIFFNAHGKELFRHTGFFGKEDILAKWQELGVTF